MRHLRSTSLLAFDAGELSTRRRARAARHLRACDRCRARLTRVRHVRDRARAATALPAPDVLGAIEARLDAGERLILPRPEASRRERRRPPRSRAVAAAVLTILAASGSVAAATGKLQPVTRWVLEHVGIAEPATAPRAGLEVPVSAEGATVELVDAGPDLLLRVERTGGALLQVIAIGDASSARFSAAARISVTGARSGELVIRVPRSAGPVRVVTGSLTLVTIAPASAPGGGADAIEVRLGDVMP